MMNVTLFSDASLCSHTGKGGWAAWLKSDEGMVRGGGPFRHVTIDTGIAEAMAAVNGIHMGLRRKLIRPGCRILIQTDNNSVWQILQNRVRRKVTARALAKPGADPSAIERDVDHRNMLIDLIVAKFNQLVATYSLGVRWRHVKGHSQVEDARSAVNRFCDRTARLHMENVRGSKKRRRQMSRKQRIRKALGDAAKREAALARAMETGNVVPFPVVDRTTAAERPRDAAAVA